MAVGKNKRLTKGKKGQKRKIVDPFTRKDWYDVKAPSVFTNRQIGKTLVTKTTGTKIASEALKGSVVESCLADLNKDEDQAFRKFKLRIEDVQGRNCLTSFHGMSLTTDKLRSLVRKWQSLIETHVDVKTTDGYILRIFPIAFTARRPNQIRKTSYALSSQQRAIRAKMVEVITKQSACSLTELVKKFIPELLGKQIAKECEGIYPLKDVFIRKVTVKRAPKFDLARLMESHAGGAAQAAPAAPAQDTGDKVEAKAAETAAE